jgi:hypothetical protein
LSSARRTGSTRHIVDGVEVTSFGAVAMARYDNDDAVCLFYGDADWNVITDTLHDDAREQATLESDEVTFKAP